jgi:hypothetical protein
MMFIYTDDKDGGKTLEKISDDTMFMLKIPVQKEIQENNEIKKLTIYEFAGPFFDVPTAKQHMLNEGLPSDTYISPITEKYMKDNVTIVDNPSERNFLN